MHVLIIGGTGNMSREIVRALLARGHEVTVVNRGQRPAPDGVKTVVVDRHDRPAFEAAVREQEAAAVIDMIAFRPDDAESTLRAVEGSVGHYIHCSTVMTYGPPSARQYLDETGPLQARSEYGRNKILIDELLLARHAATGLPVTIVKPSYTYGPEIPLHRQVGGNEWLDRVRKGKPIIAAGDGDRLFQFLPSRDAGEFFATLVGREVTFGQIYNMVHPAETTWDQWHRFAMEALGREVEIVHVPTATLLAIDPERYGSLDHNFGHEQLFSGAKAARDLPDWQPRTDRVEWVGRNIAWMDERGLVLDSDADDLEDRIIAAMRRVPDLVRG